MDPDPPEKEIIQGIAIGWYDKSNLIYFRDYLRNNPFLHLSES